MVYLLDNIQRSSKAYHIEVILSNATSINESANLKDSE